MKLVFGGTKRIATGGGGLVKMLGQVLEMRTCKKTTRVPLDWLQPGEDQAVMKSSRI